GRRAARGTRPAAQADPPARVAQRPGGDRQRRGAGRQLQGRELSAGQLRAARRRRAEPRDAELDPAPGAAPADERTRRGGEGARLEAAVTAVGLGWRAKEIEEELPQLRLVVSQARLTRAGANRRGSPPGVQRRLRMLSDRFKGAKAVGVRREPVPS